MRRRQNRGRRFGETMLGLLLLIGGISAIGGDQFLTLILIVVGLVMLARAFDRGTPAADAWALDMDDGRRVSPAREDVYGADDEFIPAQPRADQVYAHALDSVRRAGLDPAETHVLPVDIGVMAFSGDQEPMIYRTRPVLDNIDYLQPFVQLRLPTRARGRIRFEIVDSDGQVLFIHEEDHEFQRGRNLITPAARLPIHDAHAMHGDWHLRVSADDVLIAEHDFEWQESAARAIRRQISEDGELSNEVRTMMAENRLQRMSLDELLSDQDDVDDEDEAPSRQQARH